MSKPDLTPVTDADQAVEEGIRRTLSRVRSRDAVIGEEQGTTGHSQRRWIVDPIDGTKNFVRGVPVWATLIALAVDDEVVLGVVSAPQLQRRWWASVGNGAWTGRSLLKATRCEVSDVRRLEDASLSLLLALGLGRARPARRLRLAVAPLLAHPRLRRLLVLHAARRGRRRHRRRARARASTTWPRSTSSCARPAGGSPPSTAPTVRGAATRSPPTATSTTPRCPSSARWPTTTPTPTSRRRGPGSVSRPARPAGPARPRLTRTGSRPCPAPAGLATVTASRSTRARRTRGAPMRINDVIQAKRSQEVMTIGPDATRARAGRAARRAQRRRAGGERATASASTGIVSERDVVRRLHADEARPRHAGQRDHDRRRAHLRGHRRPRPT